MLRLLRVRRTLGRLVVAAIVGAAAVLGTLDAPEARAAGMLVPRDGSAPIRLQSHRVTVVLDDGLARTTVRQTFVNPHARALEAVYTFPVPEGAALVGLAMETGGQRLEGLLAERRAARRVYDQVVRRREDPALVEQVGRSTFRLSVFPVLPDKPTVVEITWIETVPLTQGEYRYVYPLALGSAAGRAASTDQDLTLSATIRSSAPLSGVSSDAPGMDARLVSAHEARASLEKTAATLDRDLVVVAKVAAREPSLAVRTFRGAKGDPFFTAVVTPPEVSEEKILPRDVTLVLDTSGSMEGEKFAQAKASAMWLLDHLRPRDRVNVLLFASEVQRFAEAPVDADAEHLTALRRFVGEARAVGGTALGDAIRAAAEAPATPGRVAMAVVLTDGLPTIGEQAPEKIVGFAKGGADHGLRVFTFGVGQDVNATLLEGVARAGRGQSETFRPQGEIETRLNAFLARTASPVLANLRLEIDGRRVDDVLPRPLPDLYLGEQSVISGRAPVAPGEHEVVVRGILDGKEIALTTKAVFPAEPGGAIVVRDVYARQKLAFLEQALRLRTGLSDDAYFAALDRGAYSTADEVTKAIVDLSLETGVQCPYTSFIALLPEDRARLDPRDTAALDGAMERARAKRRELAEAVKEGDGRSAGGATPDESKVPDASSGRGEITGESDPSRDAGVFNADPEALENLPSGATGGTSIGVGSPVVPSTQTPSAFASRRAGGGGKGGGGLGQGGGGGRGGGATNATEGAVVAALLWLKNHQSTDGRWDADGFSAQCKVNPCSGPGAADADVGATGLALLCFLGAGETHQSGTFKATVREGLKHLRNIQDTEGCFGPRTSKRFLLGHFAATLAMTEAYGMTQSHAFHDPAQRAVNFVLQCQNPGLGWGLGVRDGVNDTESTVWAAMCLRSAVMAGLEVDTAARGDALAWIDIATDPATGSVGLLRRGDTPDAASISPDALAASGLLVRIFGGRTMKDDPLVRKGADLLVARLPKWDVDGKSIDFPSWYWGTLAAFQVGGDTWKRWNEAMKTALVDHQRVDKSSDEYGSWDPEGLGSGEGGRVVATALNCLCMEVYYRFGRVFGPETTGK